MALKILYIYDRYLNRTMNWAYRLLHFTPDIEPIITSPLIIKNEFFNENKKFIFSPFQFQFPTDEWSFSKLQLITAQISFKIPFLYKNFLLKRIHEIKPAVIHIHFGNVAWEYSILSQKTNIPLVATFHGYDYRKILADKPIFKSRYEELFLRAAIISCGGTNAKEYLVSIGCPIEKIRIVHMAIDTQRVVFAKRYKEKKSLKLLQISSFVEKKGHIYTLRAFKKALKKCPDMSLTFIGEFVDKKIVAVVQEFIVKEKLQEKITVINSITYEDLLKRIPDFDVMIHPSVTAADSDTECTPVSMMDVQAIGLPVISTFHADIPEVVLHEKTGLLAPEKDTELLAEYIHFFYEADNEEYKKIAVSARRHIEDEYDVRRSGQQFSEIYHELASIAQ